jgi:hypothetical protein
VTGKGAKRIAISAIPQDGIMVNRAPGQDVLAVVAQGDTGHTVGMPCELPDSFARLRIPQDRRLLRRACKYAPTIAAEGDARYVTIFDNEGVRFSTDS